MVKSKTLIEKQLQRKNNQELVDTLIAAKKGDAWTQVASLISGPTRRRVNLNLEDFKEVQDGEKILVPGKVLSQGEIDKKIKIVALNFSEKAKTKLLKAGCEVSTILEEIKSNPSAEGIKILK